MSYLKIVFQLIQITTRKRQLKRIELDLATRTPAITLSYLLASYYFKSGPFSKHLKGSRSGELLRIGCLSAWRFNIAPTYV